LKIVLIGADGQLGTDLQKVIPAAELVPLTIKDIDITDMHRVDKVLLKHKPDTIINTAAFHRVDDCEEDDTLALKVNATGVKNLCQAALENNSVLLHLSTDYVFDGSKKTPYTEDDCPSPGTAYGISKLAGEYYIRYLLDKYFIVRSSGLFGARGCMASGGLNFIELMLRLAREKGKVRVVADQIVSPTYTQDLAKKIYQLIQTKHFGTYHITNNGQCSWYEFAEKIFELTKTKVVLEKTTSAEFKAKANRPAYSVLDNAKLRSLGMDDLQTWDQALAAYLKEKDLLK